MRYFLSSPFCLRPRPLKGCVIKSGAKWLQHTAFRAKWVPMVLFFYQRLVLLKFDSEVPQPRDVRKQTCGTNRWKFTEWSLIWTRRGEKGRIKKLFLAFKNVYFLSVHVCVLSTQPNAETKSLYLTRFDIGLYHYNVNVCMNAWITHYFRPNWH